MRNPTCVPCSGVATDRKEKHLHVLSPIVVSLLHQQVRVMFSAHFKGTWSCLSFLARAGRLRAIAITTAEACGDGRKGRSLEMSRLPFLTDMIITHCSSLTLEEFGGELSV